MASLLLHTTGTVGSDKRSIVVVFTTYARDTTWPRGAAAIIELCRRFGEPAPGPAPVGLRVPPTPAAVRAVPEWEWHRAGVDFSRRRALLAAAAVAHRLESAVTLRGEAGRALLRRVPGIGMWTAAEVAQRAWGDPDAVSVGDFHIPAINDETHAPLVERVRNEKA